MRNWQEPGDRNRAMNMNASTGMVAPPMDRPAARRGCLGCLTQIILILIVGVAVGSVFVVATERVFHPWAFYLGGHSHLLPIWEGVGRMHTEAGDYILTVSMWPSRGGRTFNLPTVTGTGYLCAPNGQRYYLRVRGGMAEKTGIDSNGKPMSLRYFYRPPLAGFTGRYELPPRIELRGHWQNPDLAMDDGGSLAAAFLPDGSLSKSPRTYYHADAKDKVPIVFHEVSPWQQWDAHCQAK